MYMHGWVPLPFTQSYYNVFYWLCVLDAQMYLTLCDSIDCTPLGSSVHGILQARIFQWVAIPFSRGSSWPRGWTWVSCIAGRFFTSRNTRETCYTPIQNKRKIKKLNSLVRVTTFKCSSTWSHVIGYYLHPRPVISSTVTLGKLYNPSEPIFSSIKWV